MVVVAVSKLVVDLGQARVVCVEETSDLSRGETKREKPPGPHVTTSAYTPWPAGSMSPTVAEGPTRESIVTVACHSSFIDCA